jgi:hypothetical protein
VLLLSAAWKAYSPRESTATIRYLFSRVGAPVETAATILVASLIAAQWMLGIILLSRGLSRQGAAVVTVMLLTFTGVVIYLWWTDAPVGCGCGIGTSLLKKVTVVDIGKTAGVGILAFFSWHGAGYASRDAAALRVSNCKGESSE